ncbi:MAG: hypothetical protein FJ213_00470 [Ignavibacteria bacterium]|nr:hypothetical protein [Ignavibacteria bacterium]
MVKINFSEFIKIPNLISSARILLLIPSIILFQDFEINRIPLILIGIIAALLDNLDGYLARRFNEITELGKILDPLADKLIVAVFGIGLVLNGAIPTWFAALVISRDLIIILFSLLFMSKVDKVAASNFIGKFTVTMTGVSFLLALFGIETGNLIFDGFIILTSIFVVISLVVYARTNYFYTKHNIE